MSFWSSTSGSGLAQGDYLPRCRVPILIDDYGTTGSTTARVVDANLIIITQSCDLSNEKNASAALCPIYTLQAFEIIVPALKKKGAWEDVRKGRREGLILLASPTNPNVGRDALVVDFRDIYSLPTAYLARHAVALGPRWRLSPPYLEHFSQAFARFFMRVGLPSAVPPILD